jgi:diaminohydroxyphosphoribosylaminopyrimidine deaminase/5-amino-6-(5-phosphoribosylamino)uracil reductase
MKRCLTLAEKGLGKVSPNPMVGSVLVYDNTIIGEGYHEQYGCGHAEVNCIQSVKEENRHLIKDSTLYVSLEPCNHFGKTPPCTDLIIQEQIKKVVIGCRDPHSKVNGAGIEKLKNTEVDVEEGVLNQDAIFLNRRFFTFHNYKRPYIILKWAQSNNGKIAGREKSRLKISNEITDRLVHKWRSEEDAIIDRKSVV